MNLLKENKIYYIVLIFFLFSSSLTLAIKETILDENNSSQTVLSFYSFIYSILIVESFFIYKLLRCIKNFIINVLIISFFLILNSYCLNISISSFFFSYVLHYTEVLILIGWFIFFPIVYFLISRKIFLKIFCLCYLFLNIILIFDIDRLIYHESRLQDINLEIKEKKNLYIYSFESFIPPSIAKKHFGVEMNIDKIKKNKYFTIFKNNFADDYPTKNSLNSIISLNPNNWREDKLYKQNNFTGMDNGKLFKFLKINGYKITTGYKYSTLGKVGQFIDTFHTQDKAINANEVFTFCLGKANKLPTKYFQLFGYCNFEKSFFNPGETSIPSKMTNKIDFHKFAVDQIKMTNQPTLKWFHMIPYDHPDSSNTDYKKYFQNNVDKAIRLIEKIIENKINNDPNSILIIFGDHNMMTWRFSTEEKLKKNIQSNYDDFETYKFMDTFPVFAGISDDSLFCEKYISKLKNSSFTTNSMIVNAILSCLAKTDSLFSKPINYRYNDLNYSDYLYE